MAYASESYENERYQETLDRMRGELVHQEAAAE